MSFHLPYIIDFRTEGERRSGQERRGRGDASLYKGPERRINPDRRSGTDRRALP